MLVILALALIVGIGMMSMVFVPQFAENTLRLKAGSGGYLVTLLAVFSGIASPISGRLIDTRGPRFVLLIGFAFTILGALTLGYVATLALNFASILGGLALMGLGVGFTMGPPLNYLVLATVPDNEGAIGIATMSLVRSIGVTISPGLMIGFIVDAAKGIPGALMQTLASGPAGAHMPAMGDLAGANPNAANLFASLQTADVTTIVDRLVEVLKQVAPTGAQTMIINAVQGSAAALETAFQSTLNQGYSHMFTAAAVIAALGLVTSLFLHGRQKTGATAG